MSELTFNIADYRPLSRVKSFDQEPAAMQRRGFVVLSSHSEPERNDPRWLEPLAQVVDIRSVRETHRPCPSRGKVLRFRTPASHHVYTMPLQHGSQPADDDPGPMVA